MMGEEGFQAQVKMFICQIVLSIKWWDCVPIQIAWLFFYVRVVIRILGQTSMGIKKICIRKIEYFM